VFLAPAEDPLPSDQDIEGTVVDFSDSGTEARWFAVVEVVRKQNVIVPVTELRVLRAG
jgi:hypothetical protein